MSSTLDTIREVLQVALLPKLTAIEKDLQALRAEVAQSNQALRAEVAQSNQALRAEVAQSNQEMRAEAIENNQGLRAELELKFSILVSEIQKVGIRTELTAEKIKAETESYVHRSITPLAERVAVLEMSFRTLKEELERES
jgi:DNA recombination protein RmuC